MASKQALLLLALLASAAVLATARAADLQTTYDTKEKKMAKDAAGVKDWGGGGSGAYSHVCEYGCCRHAYHGGCQKCCDPPGGGAGQPEVNNLQNKPARP